MCVYAFAVHVKDYLWMGGALEGVLSSALLVKGSSEDVPRASDVLLLQQAQTKADDIKTGSETDFHNGVMGESDVRLVRSLERSSILFFFLLLSLWPTRHSTALSFPGSRSCCR